jgi:hypothetical protein
MGGGTPHHGLERLATKIRNSHTVNAAKTAIHELFLPVISGMRRMALPGKLARQSRFGRGLDWMQSVLMAGKIIPAISIMPFSPTAICEACSTVPALPRSSRGAPKTKKAGPGTGPGMRR